ncbi:MAG: helix-turn-helix domain-containing protein [Oscillospiraceae bacterium]|nr:helix-turn-helix domain-containing protein [Oscillospiraceae bacterium]
MNKNIGEKLFERRKAAGLSQEELAEKIGVSRQAVSKWERGESSPDTENLIALAKLYNISLDELVFGESGETKYENTQEESDKVDISPGRIQVESHNGDKVNINWKGIHVDTKNTNVHIDKEGVNVIENGHIVFPKKPINSPIYRFFKRFPYPVLTVIAYILFGFLEICGGWGLGWLIFLTIPLYYTLIDAIARKNASEFAYPVLTVLVYLYIGMVNGLWHPGWLIFLTIPVYYFFTEFIKKVCAKL